MNKKFKKVVAVGVSVATALWLSGAAAILPVSAASLTQAQINAIVTLLQSFGADSGTITNVQSALTGQPTTTTPTITTGGYSFTRNLYLGIRGDDVTALQNYLKTTGHYIYPTSTGYYGPVTQTAVAAWQSANGVAPASGYFGSVSRAKYTSLGGTTTTTGGTTVVIPGTGLAVSLAADNPSSGTIPGGAVGVPFMKFVVAGSGTINDIVFKRVGPGAAGDFVSGGIYLFDGDTKLTTGKSINSTTHEVTFTNVGLAVSGTKTLILKANINITQTVGNRDAFEITSMTGSVAVTGVPLKGNEQTYSGQDVGRVSIASSSLPANPKVGDLAAKLVTFKLTANSTEDVSVKGITLYYAGAVSRSTLSNFVLKQAGNTIATVSAINSKDRLVFAFTSPFKLEKGTNRTFEVYADIASGARSGSAETVKFYVEEIGDVDTVGSLYGYPATIHIIAASGNPDTSGSFDSNNFQQVTLDAGLVTITFNGPTTSDIAKKAADAIVYRFSIKAGNRIEVRKLSFDIDIAGNNEAIETFDDFKVVDEGTGAVLTSATSVSASIDPYEFTDIFEVAAGQTRSFKVTVDGDNDFDGGETIQVHLNAFGTTDIKNLDNNTFVTPSSDVVPNSKLSGNTHTVKAPSLEINLAGTPASQTVNAGTSNVNLLGVNVKAVADAIKVTQIVVSASSTALAQLSVADLKAALGTVRLYDGSTQIGEAKSFTGSTAGSITATFSSLNWTIVKDDVRSLYVRIDGFSTTASTTGYYAYLGDLSTAITAQDSESNTVTLAGSTNLAGTVTITVGTPSLTIARVDDGTDESAAGIVIANGTRALGKFRFTSTNGDIKVTKLTIGLANSTGATSTGLSDDVSSVILKDSTGATVFSGNLDATGDRAGLAQGENSNGYFTVSKNTSKTYTLYGVLNDIQTDSSQADHGTSLYGLIIGSSTVSGRDYFKAISGNTTLTTFTKGTGVVNGNAFEAGVLGNKKLVYKTKPTLSLPSSGKPTTLVNGGEIFRFTIAADANGPLALKAFGVNISTLGVTIATGKSNITLREVGGTTITIGTVSGALSDSKSAIAGGTQATDAGIHNGDSVDVYIILSSPFIVSAGGSRTIAWEQAGMTISAASGVTKSVTTKLDTNTTLATAAGTTGTFLGGGRVDYADTPRLNPLSWVWSDESSGDEDEGDANWSNDYYVKDLPSQVITVSQ